MVTADEFVASGQKQRHHGLRSELTFDHAIAGRDSTTAPGFDVNRAVDETTNACGQMDRAADPGDMPLMGYTSAMADFKRATACRIGTGIGQSLPDSRAECLPAAFGIVKCNVPAGHPGVQFVGESCRGYASAEKRESFGLVNVGTDWSLNDGSILSMRVANLFDKTRAVCLRDNGYGGARAIPGEPRRFELQLASEA